MAENQQFEHESLQDCRSVVEYLNALSEGMTRSRLQVGSNGDEIELHPQGLLRFSVKARRKGDSARLTLRMSWDEKAAEKSLDRPPLVIRSKD